MLAMTVFTFGVRGGVVLVMVAVFSGSSCILLADQQRTPRDVPALKDAVVTWPRWPERLDLLFGSRRSGDRLMISLLAVTTRARVAWNDFGTLALMLRPQS